MERHNKKEEIHNLDFYIKKEHEESNGIKENDRSYENYYTDALNKIKTKKL